MRGSLTTCFAPNRERRYRERRENAFACDKESWAKEWSKYRRDAKAVDFV